ncbi:MAG TPA: hypothetical protein VGC65_09825 [Bacteroidia bacterium]|jgi:hypothetical protein
MKSIVRNTLLLAITFISSISIAKNTIVKDSLESKECLSVVGIALNEKNEIVDGVEVKLFRENEEMEWVEITNVAYHDHNFTFVLDVNEYYTIEISKPGYIKRSVAISTKLPANVNIKTLFKYGFEVVLLKDKEENDNYYLDFPVALISYNERTEVFENNNNYTRHIKSKIREEERVKALSTSTNKK